VNYNYHRNILESSKKEHCYVQQALRMWPKVESAMKNLINGSIDINHYIDEITVYDKFMWDKFHEKPQKSNPINITQNKKYSSWREQLWAPIFDLIRKSLEEKWDTELVLIQDDNVARTVYNSGDVKIKSVDNGIAIKHDIFDKIYLIPILIVEDKGGNACATTFDGVEAQALTFHRSFPNAKFAFITDNKISVSTKNPIHFYDNINLVICQRGKNKVKASYPLLNKNIFNDTYNGILESLSDVDHNKFLKYNEISSNNIGTLRESIDSDGIVWNNW